MEISNKNSGISIIDSIILFFEINIKLQVYVIPFLILAAYFEYNGSKITYLSIKELGTVVCYIFVIKNVYKRFKSEENFKFKIQFKPILKEYIFVIISIIAYILIFGNTIGLLLQNIPQSDLVKSAFDELDNAPLLLQFISLCVIAPIFEEIIYRGIMLEQLNKRCGAVKAILISSLFFGIIHLNVHQAVNGFFIGIVMGFIYIKTDSLILTMFLHFINNLYCLIAGYIPYLEKIEANFSIVTLVCGVILLCLAYRFFNNLKVNLDRKTNLEA
ncbi:CPBP family intramembrane metalloprotease [Clostridium botulinum]|nr:CPBP family intramembrane metalloprotease [Clostridium botulinum]EKO2041570.1 CPBP family intramembrane metalloprotease [Clostridium botulinum]